MKIFTKNAKWFLSFAIVALFATGTFTGCENQDSSAPTQSQQTFNLPTSANPRAANGADLGQAIATQNRHNDEILAIDGVIGTGAGVNEDGTPAVYIFTERHGVSGIPASVEGIRTHIEHVGTVKARQVYTGAYRNPTWSGVSIGNDNECAAGTLGCVVTKNGKNYILSNNHVLARENKAVIGEKIDQPGRYELNCNPGVPIASLSEFTTIIMKRNANNVIDAGIAELSITGFTSQMAIASYFPAIAPIAATVGMPVKKTGRTTGLTRGTVQAINVTITVQYSRGSARFIKQIYVTPGNFSGAGDSGSLIVEDPSSGITYSPVGLLFAGSSSGTFANPIQDVLGAFSVTIVPN